VDKDSGLFFWYNCRDESSQWADSEGEGWAGYGSRRASTVDATFTNTLKDAALNPTSSNKSETATAEVAAPKSPRAPTAADEKEMTAANVTASESKKRGIAEQDDGDDDTPVPAEGAEAKTADTTAPSSEKKDDEVAAAEAKQPEGSNSPRAASPRAALVKLSPRPGQSAKAPPATSAEATVEEGLAEAKPTETAQSEEKAPGEGSVSPRTASPRPGSVKLSPRVEPSVQSGQSVKMEAAQSVKVAEGQSVKVDSAQSVKVTAGQSSKSVKQDALAAPADGADPPSLSAAE
jgi:hypothetical protein